MSDFGSDIFDEDKTSEGREKAGDESATLADAAPTKRRRRRRAKPDDGDADSAAPDETAERDRVDEDAPAPTRRKRSRRRAGAERARLDADAPDTDDIASDDTASDDTASGDTASGDMATGNREPAGEAEPPATRESGRHRAGRFEPDDDDERTPSAFEPADDFDDSDARADDDETDSDRPASKRSRRRRRSRRGRGTGDDEGRANGERRVGRSREERGRRRGSTPAPAQHWTERREEFPTVPGQRLAVFIDLDRLVAESASRDGEIAFTKLKATLGGKRNMIRAVAYGSDESARVLEGPVKRAGFEIRPVRDRSELSVALAVDAMAIGPRVDCVVVAPVSAEFGPLATALRTLGIRVESAGFGDSGANADLDVVDHQDLGTECMFVP